MLTPVTSASSRSSPAPTWPSPTSTPRPASLRRRCRGRQRRWRSSARWSRPNFRADYRAILPTALRRRGIALQKCGRPAEAVSAFREAIAILEGLAEPDIRRSSTTSPATSRCSPASPPRPALGLTAADGRAEADKAMESLRRAVAAGWSRPDHMRADTDLDPIRSRPDFQMLVLDLAMPDEPFARPD